MERASEFIQLFNQLVDHLRQATGVDKGIGFPQLLSLASKKDPAVKRSVVRLRDYGDLRNAIVHHSAYPEIVIAEPTDETVRRFREVVEEITAPRLLLPAFRKNIRVFSPDEKLVEVLRYMRDSEFAQVVVRDGGTLLLLTSRGIARWLERQAGSDVVKIDAVPLRDALEFEGKESCILLAGNRTVFEAQQAFVDALVKKRRRLFAILITENGRADEEPIGIVTPGDLLDTNNA